MATMSQYCLLVLVFVFKTVAAEQAHSHSNEKWTTREGSVNHHAALNKFIQDVLDAKDELDGIRNLHPGGVNEKLHNEGVGQTALGHFYQDSDFLVGKPAFSPLHSYVGTQQVRKYPDVSTKQEKKLNEDQDNNLKSIQIRNSEKRSQSSDGKPVPYSLNKNGIERDADLLKFLLRNSRGNNLEEKQQLDTNKLSHILEELKNIYSNAGSVQHADARQKLDVNELDSGIDPGKIMKYRDLMRFKNQQLHKKDKNERFNPSDSQHTDRQYENMYERQVGDKTSAVAIRNEEQEQGDTSDELHSRERSKNENIVPVQLLSRRGSVDESPSKKTIETTFEDPVVVKYFQTHGRRHNRKIPPVSQDHESGNILFSDGGSTSDLQGDVRLAQAQKRLELEDADGLLVGMHARIGTTDNQMERENVNQDKVTPKSDQDEDIQQQLEEERRIFNSLGAGRLDYPPYSEEQNLFLNEYKQKGAGGPNDFVKALSQISSGESNYLRQLSGGITENLPDSNMNTLMQRYGRFARGTNSFSKNENNQVKKDRSVPGDGDNFDLEKNVDEVSQDVAHQDSRVNAAESSSRELRSGHEKEVLEARGIDGVEQLEHKDMVSSEDDPQFIKNFVPESENSGEIYPLYSSRHLLHFEDDSASLQRSRREGEEQALVHARDTGQAINIKRSLSCNTETEKVSEDRGFADAGQRHRRDVVKRPGAIWLDEEEDVETTGEGRETSVENKHLGLSHLVPRQSSPSSAGIVEDQRMYDNVVSHPVEKKRSDLTGQNKQKENLIEIPNVTVIDALSPRDKRGTYVKNINCTNTAKDFGTDVNINPVKDADEDIGIDSADLNSEAKKLIKTKRFTDPSLKEKFKKLVNKYGDDREYLKAIMKKSGRNDKFGLDRSMNAHSYHKNQEIGSDPESHIFDVSLQPNKREIKCDSDALDDRNANENESENAQGTNERLVLEKTSTDYEDASKELKELMKSSRTIPTSPKSVYLGNADNLKNREPVIKSGAEGSRVGRSAQEEEFQTRQQEKGKRSIPTSSSHREPESLNVDKNALIQKREESGFKDFSRNVRTPMKLNSSGGAFIGRSRLVRTGHNLEPVRYKNDILYKKNKRGECSQKTLLPNENLQTYEELIERRDTNSHSYARPKRSFDKFEMNELELISLTNKRSSENTPILAKGHEMVKRERLNINPYVNGKPAGENELSSGLDKVKTLRDIPFDNKDNIGGMKDNNFEKSSRHARQARNIPQDLLNITFSPQELDRLISEGNLPVLKRVKRSGDDDRQHGEGNTRKVTLKVRENKQLENNTRAESGSVFSNTVIHPPEMSSAVSGDLKVRRNAEHSANKQDVEHKSAKRESTPSDGEKNTLLKDKDSVLIDANVNTMESDSKRSKDEIVADGDQIKSKYRYAPFTTNEQASAVSSADDNEIIHRQKSEIVDNHEKSEKDDKHFLNKRETIYHTHNDNGMLGVNNMRQIDEFSHGYSGDSSSLYGNTDKSDLLDVFNTQRGVSYFDNESPTRNEKDKIGLNFLDKIQHTRHEETFPSYKTPKEDFEIENFDDKKITNSGKENNISNEKYKDELNFLDELKHSGNEETVSYKVPEGHFEMLNFNPSEQNAVLQKETSFSNERDNDLRYLEKIKDSSNQEATSIPDDHLGLPDFDTSQKTTKHLNHQKDTDGLNILEEDTHGSNDAAFSNRTPDKEFEDTFSNKIPDQVFEWKSKLENEFKEKSLNDKSMSDITPKNQDNYLNRDFSLDKDIESNAELLRNVISKTPKEGNSNMDFSHLKNNLHNDMLGDKMSLKDGEEISKSPDLDFSDVAIGNAGKLKPLDSMESGNFKSGEELSPKLLFGNDKQNSVKLTSHSLNFRNHNGEAGLKQPLSSRLVNPTLHNKYASNILPSQNLLAKPIETNNVLNEKTIDNDYRDQHHPVCPLDTNNKYSSLHSYKKLKIDHNALNKKCSDDHGNKKQGSCYDGKGSDDLTHGSKTDDSRTGSCAQHVGQTSTCGGYPSQNFGPLFPDMGDTNSKPYKGELDDGVIGMNIVDTILNQVYRTKHLQETLGPGLHRKYLPTQVHKFCRQGDTRQKMISEIANIINKGFEEEMKRDSCNALPRELKEFFDWLVKTPPCPTPSSHKCQQSKQEPCGSEGDLCRKSRLLNKLNEEYEHLPDCDKHKVKSVHNMLEKDMNIVNCRLKDLEKKLIHKTTKCHTKSENSPKAASETKYSLPVFTFNEGDSFTGSTTEFILPYSFLLHEDKKKRGKNASLDYSTRDNELQNLINKDLEDLGLAPHKYNTNNGFTKVGDSSRRNNYKYTPNVQGFDNSQTCFEETKPAKELDRNLRSFMDTPSVGEEMFHGQMESENWPPRYGYKSFQAEPRARVMRLHGDDEEEAEGPNPVSEEYRRLVAQADQARRKRAEA